MKVFSSLLLAFFMCTQILFAQDSTKVFNWSVQSRKLGEGQYRLSFFTQGSKGWQLYAPNQDLDGVATVELQLGDSSIRTEGSFQDSGTIQTVSSTIFSRNLKMDMSAAAWSVVVRFAGEVPASLQGKLLYSYGRGDEFYPGTSFDFSVPLEGGQASGSRIRISTIDIAKPVNDCGDEIVSQSFWRIFWIGLGAGLLSLLFPCIFPMIPFTVSFFTKQEANRHRGVINAFWYGFFIFLIFIVLSLPFHLFDIQPEVLNNISTSVPLNLIFFAVFIAFAISFFGYYEIGLPGSLATKVDAKSGKGSLIAIFFMALTLVITSFSCTGPILGSLLVSAFTSQNGAWQLTTGMAGFGIGLGFPFVLFALFPNWLQSKKKSSAWTGELKVVFGFIELAMAVKFLSQADLVKQWGLFKREIFIGSWVVIGICIVLYLAGVRFGAYNKTKFTKARIFFILLFSVITIYLIPGLTNTRSARLQLVSGFPPPVCYSVYKNPVNCETGVKPLENEYEKALELARAQHKPVLIDFTGWACVNCRRMEENVWVDEDVRSLMKNDFIVVSLYVDERRKLPLTERVNYTSRNGSEKSLVTVGDKWATFQFENFNAVSQPQYAIISPDEVALTKTKSYTPSPKQFAAWLRCGLDAYAKVKK